MVEEGKGDFMAQSKSNFPGKHVARRFDYGSSSSAVQHSREDVDYLRALAAYQFWYPIVAMEGGQDGYWQQGILHGKSANTFSARPQHMLMTNQSDSPYAFILVDLKNGPLTIQLPSGPFVANVMDYNDRWIMDMGISGKDKGKGRRYVIVPPDYGGDIPENYYVGYSETSKILIDIRILPRKGDLKKALAALQKVRLNCLSPNHELNLIDFTTNDLQLMPFSWDDSIQYWETLHRIIDREPPTERLQPMYRLLKLIGIEKGQLFAPDERMVGILEKAEQNGRYSIRDCAKGDRPDRFSWMDRKWAWTKLLSDHNNLQKSVGTELMVSNRLADSNGRLPALPGGVYTESLFWLGFRDTHGAFLDGGKTYQLVVPDSLHNKLAWSVTVYDVKTRSTIQTSHDRNEIRSWTDNVCAESDGSIILHFGPQPVQGSEDRWIETLPGQKWYAYIRVFGPEKATRDCNWEPGDFTEINCYKLLKTAIK